MVNTRSSSILEGIYRASSDPSRRVGLFTETCPVVTRCGNLHVRTDSVWLIHGGAGRYGCISIGAASSAARLIVEVVSWWMAKDAPHHITNSTHYVRLSRRKTAMMHFWSPVDQSIVSPGIRPCTEQCYRWELGFYEMSEVIQKLSDTAVGGDREAGPCFRLVRNLDQRQLPLSFVNLTNQVHSPESHRHNADAVHPDGIGFSIQSIIRRAL